MNNKLKICFAKIPLNFHSNDGIQLQNQLKEIALFIEKIPEDKNLKKNFIEQHIRNPLVKIIENKKYKDFIQPHLYFFYDTLVELARFSPRNAGKQQWICPITLKKAGECESRIALSSGYLYDKDALLEWFRSSGSFTDPVTRTPLSFFDIHQIQQLEEGLKIIAELKLSLPSKKIKLLKEQHQYFLPQKLKPHAYIKKTFLQMTSLQIDNSTKNRLSEHLREFIKNQVVQLAPLSSYQKDIQGNFSRINLSGLCFDNHTSLTNSYGLTLDLRAANLSRCIFMGDKSKQNVMHADLTDACLESAEFLNLPEEGISIATSNFTNANLKNVNFTGVSNFTRVNFTHANLVGAYLYNKDGIKITGNNLKNFFLEQPEIMGLKNAFFEEKDLKEIEQPKKSKLSFAEFKTISQQNSCFSKMRWGIYFGIFKTMDDVERYAKENPNSRTSEILACS